MSDRAQRAELRRDGENERTRIDLVAIRRLAGVEVRPIQVPRATEPAAGDPRKQRMTGGDRGAPAETIRTRRTFLVGLLTVVQAVMPAAVAVLSLAAIVVMHGQRLDFRSPEGVIVAVLCLILVHVPRQITSQLAPQRLSTAIRIAMRWTMMLIVLAAVAVVMRGFGDFPNARSIFVTWAVITPLLVLFLSIVTQDFTRSLLRSASDVRKCVFVGYNVSSTALAARLGHESTLHMQPVGFFDDRSAERLASPPDFPLLGKLADLPEFAKRHRVDVIFISLPIGHIKRVIDLVDDLQDTTASIYYVPDVYVFDLIQARAGQIAGVPVVAMLESPFSGYDAIKKRVTDVVLAVLLTIGLLPVLAMIALLVKISSPGPAVFRQRRYGLDGEEITVYKFRSMRVTEDGPVIRQASREDDRITKIGAFLRRTSLDELPQLVNVLQGRMSLVGPRPHAVAHNEAYRKLIKGYMLRHKVLPGITGLAQINGCRGETTRLEEMEARITYDLDYLRNWSPGLDLKILVLTAFRVLGDRKAY